MQVGSRQRGSSLIEGMLAGWRRGSSRRADSGTGSAVSVIAAAGGFRPRHHQAGFSLVELLITVTVAMVLIVIAVPSFRNIMLSNRLTTAANDMVVAINTARMEAIKRNAAVQFCSNSVSANSGDTLGQNCGAESGAVYALSSNGNSATQLLAGTAGVAQPLQFNGGVTALRFTAQGVGRKVGATTPYNDIVADICTSSLSTDNHRVITMAAGSILVTAKSSGDCPSS
jgi:type IV fimbrial biogenesis protein FimT